MARLHRARVRAHRAFDQTWERLGMTRGAAYRWLAHRLGIPVAQCHIGLFDAATCDRVVALCQGFGVLPISHRRRAA